MDIKQFRYFIAVAEELHFGRAAQRLFISQPPLSLQIKALEEELGVQLFLRDRRSVKLTAAGTAFLVHAREILRMVPMAREAARRAAHGQLGVLRIGYSGSAMFSDKILGCIARYREAFPAVNVELREGPTHMHIEELLLGRADVGLVRGPLPPSALGLPAQLVARERLVVAVSLHHPLAHRKKIWLRELCGERFVAFQKIVGAALNQLLTGLYLEAGIEPDISIEATGILSALGLVGIGAGISIIPACVASINFPNVAFCDIEDAQAQTELYAVAAMHPAPTTREFLAFLQTVGSTTPGTISCNLVAECLRDAQALPLDDEEELEEDDLPRQGRAA